MWEGKSGIPGLDMSIVTVGLAGVCQVLLVVLPSEMSFFTNYISGYIYSSLAPLFIIGMLLHVTTLALQALVIYTLIEKRSGLMMVGATISLFIVTVVPTDPDGVINTLAGSIHVSFILIGTSIYCILLFRLALEHNYNTLGQSISIILAAFSFLISIPFGILGLTERIFYLSVIYSHYKIAVEMKKKIPAVK
jgi:hypothetical protein